MKNEFCKAVIEIDRGKATRGESCKKKSKTHCCYLCNHRKFCEISCTYLDGLKKSMAQEDSKTEKIEQCERIDSEIRARKERMEKLAMLFAEGKIREESYVLSSRTLRDKIEELEKERSQIKEKKRTSDSHYVV